MAQTPCAVCGNPYDEDDLLFSDQGRICGMCELDIAEQGHTTRGVWVTILSGPLTALTASLSLCIPYLGPIAALVIGALALWRGVVAVQAFFGLANDDNVTSVERALLAITGAFTMLWGLGIVLLTGLSLVVLLIQNLAS